MTSVKPVFSFKVLSTLSAAVLLAHLAALRGTPLHLDHQPIEAQRSFITRSIAPQPVVLSPAFAPPQKKAPAPSRAEISAPSELTAGNDPAKRSSQAEIFTQTTKQSAANPDLPVAQADAPANPDGPSAVPASLAAATILPGAMRLKYQVASNRFPYSLSAVLLWQPKADGYDARLEFSALGISRSQTSRGQLTPEGLSPLRFSDKYRSEVAAHFNWEQGKVTFSANTPDLPLQAGAQDRLSILVQLAALMAGDPGRYPAATTLALQTIGPRDGSVWHFTVGERETMNLPGGELATLKLVRHPREEFDQKIELWLAPALAYLPARIRITEPNSDYVDQKWLATETQP